jgi:hypothetical protein
VFKTSVGDKMADTNDINPLPSQDMDCSRAEIYIEANLKDWPSEGESEEWPVVDGDFIVIFHDTTFHKHGARTSWTFASNIPTFGANPEIQKCLAGFPTKNIGNEGCTEDELEAAVDQWKTEAFPMSIEPTGEFIRRVKDHDPLVEFFIGISPDAFNSIVKRPDTTLCGTTSINSPTASKQSPTSLNTQQSDHRPVNPSPSCDPARDSISEDGLLTPVGTEWKTWLRRPNGRRVRVVARSKTPMDTQSLAEALSSSIHGWTESPGLSERPELGDQDIDGL